MRPLPFGHALRIPIILHRRLDKILINRRQHRIQRVESRVQEHLMRLNFECVEGFSVEGLARSFGGLDCQGVC